MEMVLTRLTLFFIIIISFISCNSDKRKLEGIWERCPIPNVRTIDRMEYPFSNRAPHISCEKIYISDQFIEYPNFMTGNIKEDNFIYYIPYKLKNNKILLEGKEFNYSLLENSSKLCIVDKNNSSNCFRRVNPIENEEKRLYKIELSYTSSIDEDSILAKLIIKDNILTKIDNKGIESTIDLSLNEKLFLEKLIKRCQLTWSCTSYNQNSSDSAKYALKITYENKEGHYGTCVTVYGLGLDLPFELCAVILGVLSIEELHTKGN